MQEFFINQNSTLPVLRMELINDGRNTFRQNIFNKAIQNATVYFNMYDAESNELKISKANAEILSKVENGCDDSYAIEYKWKERDTKKKGVFKGQFIIEFNGNLTQDGVDFPSGKLIMPIEEDLIIFIK